MTIGTSLIFMAGIMLQATVAFEISISVENTGTSQQACFNGGIQFDGKCICDDGFTGERCETFFYISSIFNDEFPKSHLKEDSTLLHVQRLRREVDASGSGSGEEPEKEKCSNYKEIFINGECQVPSVIYGEYDLGEGTPFVDAYADKNTNEYQNLKQSIEDFLNDKFSDVPNFEQVGVVGFKNDSGTVVYHKLYLSPINEDELPLVTSMINQQAENITGYNSQVSPFAAFNPCDYKTDCGEDSKCIYENGDYYCTCNSGFFDVTASGQRPGTTCREQCKNVDNTDYCMYGDCHKIPDGEYCTCRIGYYGDQCDSYWFAWEISTIVLGVALSALLVVLFVSAIMVCVRRSWKDDEKGSDNVELNSTASNGKGKKGVVNPYGADEENGGGENEAFTAEEECERL